MKINTIDIDGKKNSIEVLDKIISSKINKKLVSLVEQFNLIQKIIFNIITQ